MEVVVCICLRQPESMNALYMNIYIDIGHPANFAASEQPREHLTRISFVSPGSKGSLEGSTGEILKTVGFQVKVHINIQ